jgi:hypothetical protein
MENISLYPTAEAGGYQQYLNAFLRVSGSRPVEQWRGRCFAPLAFEVHLAH